jgi:aminomethyltransferase
MLKRTPLFAAHQRLGGKLIEFGGWEMPVHYTGIRDEHQAVRTAAGLFDISHMGELFVSGPGALEFLNQTLTNDLYRLTPGQGQYSLMCNERGGVIDDLYVYRIGENQFLLVVNAARIQADAGWLERRFGSVGTRGNNSLENASDKWAAVALQGPRAARFVDHCFPIAPPGQADARLPAGLKKNQIASFPFDGQIVYVSRTGYTGEDGFEVVAPAEIVESVWNRILEAGRPFGLKPCGLGARDTLRTEMGYPLYGHELDENTTPIEAGLGFFVALEKGDFVGRAVLAEQKAAGVSRRCVAFKMTGNSPPPRPQYSIWSIGAEARKIGEVCSGTQSPSLGIGIGMGYVPPEFAKAGTIIEIEIRGRRSPAVIVTKPIYRKPV